MRTKRILGIMVVSLFLIGLLGACGSRNASDVTSVSDVQDNAVSETVPQETVPEEEADMNTGSGSEHPVPSDVDDNVTDNFAFRVKEGYSHVS